MRPPVEMLAVLGWDILGPGTFILSGVVAVFYARKKPEKISGLTPKQMQWLGISLMVLGVLLFVLSVIARKEVSQ